MKVINEHHEYREYREHLDAVCVTQRTPFSSFIAGEHKTR